MAKKVDSRRKGHSFEREIVLKINELLYINGIKKDGEIINVKRNLEQYQSKSLADINLPGFSIECKRYKKNNSDQPRSVWWDQVCEACADDVPILVYKYDYQKIMIAYPALLFSFDDHGYHFESLLKEYPATMPFENFMELFMVLLKAHYGW